MIASLKRICFLEIFCFCCVCDVMTLPLRPKMGIRPAPVLAGQLPISKILDSPLSFANMPVVLDQQESVVGANRGWSNTE